MGIACSWSCCIDGFHRCLGPSLSSDRRPWCVGIGPAFAINWRWKSRSFGGRTQVDADLRALIQRMSAENPLWGAPRIHGELLKLGFDVAQSSVANGMDRPCSRRQRHAESVGGFEEHEEDTPCPAKQTLQSHAPLVSIPVRTRCI